MVSGCLGDREGWGGGEGEVGAHNSVPLTALPKQQFLAAIGFYAPLFLSSTNLFSL